MNVWLSSSTTTLPTDNYINNFQEFFGIGLKGFATPSNYVGEVSGERTKALHKESLWQSECFCQQVLQIELPSEGGPLEPGGNINNLDGTQEVKRLSINIGVATPAEPRGEKKKLF